MDKTDLHREMFRKEVLLGTGLIGPLDAYEELKRSRFFIESMELYIDSSETAEIKQLEIQAQALSPEAKDEFWQWNYPIHWQDIFGVRIRSSFCIQLCSQVEATLGDIAHRIQVIERIPAIGKTNKKEFKTGSTIEKHKRYFTKYAKFEGFDEVLWAKMGFVFRIRNAHVHFQGFDSKMDKDIEFRQFLTALPNVGIEHNFIELKTGSCEALMEIVECFHEEIIKKYEFYRKKCLASYQRHNNRDKA